jgi:D-aminopeptidase
VTKAAAASRAAGDRPPDRARAREIGVAPGRLPAGAANAITDVPGLRVGHATVVEGTGIRTGVTAIVHDALLPHGDEQSGSPQLPGTGKLAAGLSVFNGFGKMVGSTQVAELGVIETPVLLTATLSVFRVADALLSYLRDLSYLHEGHSGEPPGTLNPVVAEANDGYLSDIWARPITAEHVRTALDTAAGGPVAEGCVGAGTGTGALGFKAGIGTSSRIVSSATGPVTLGVLVQANFSGELTVLGAQVPATRMEREPPPPDRGNSCVIVLATDAALSSRQLERVAGRAFAGMARVGSDFSGSSGDYALAISTAPAAGPAAASAGYLVPDKDLDLLFQAAIEATEEAILNSLFMAVTTTGFRGHVRHAVALDEVVARANRDVG